MKKLIFTLIVLFTTSALFGQSAEVLLGKANQQLVLFESEKSSNSAAMYDYLHSCYTSFMKVLETASPASEPYSVAREKLEYLYPILKNAAITFSNINDLQKSYLFGMAYMTIPNVISIAGADPKNDELYPQILYNTGVAAYKLSNLRDAAECFNNYVECGVPERNKDCIIFLNMIYLSQKNFVEQEKILKKAISLYPNTMDFHYNLINLYISTKNNSALLGAIDNALRVDPNDINILPIKARMLEAQGKVEDALGTYKKLLTLFPNDLSIMKGIAKCDFKIGSELNNNSFKAIDETQAMELKQKAYPYIYEARQYFEKILDKEPSSNSYMRGLQECYKFLGMNAESDVMNNILLEKGTYASFRQRLHEYRQLENSLKQDHVNVVAGDPPVLITSISAFEDANNNKVIDAGEAFSISVTLENKGLGDASNVRLILAENGGLGKYFEGAKEIDAGIIPAGSKKDFTFRYTLNEESTTGEANITIYALEANGMDADPYSLVVNVQESAKPRLRVADFQFLSDAGTSITLGDRGKLVIAVQNVGHLAAENTSISFELPNNIIPVAELNTVIEQINPGEVVPITFDFLVNKRFALDSIPIGVKIEETTTFSVLQDVYKLKLGDYLSSANKMVVEGKLDERKDHNKSYSLAFQSELMKNIPKGAANNHRYALIIGNEDYSIVGENAEINVPFACNDAIVFKEYCTQTFGIPEEHIKYIDNATAGIMRESLDWLINMGNVNPNAELFFFYSGHGSNDDATKEPYLLPVDITGRHIKLGIPLNQLYADLSAAPCQGSYVFIDACFSGGYKSEKPLLTQKGVRVVPKVDMPTGKLICFSSSTGDQTSSVYFDKQHGYFTYFLLKSIQDAGGNIELSQIFEKTKTGVEEATALSGKLQSPQMMVSPQWTDWNQAQLKK